MQVPQYYIDSDFDNLKNFGIKFYSDINLKNQTTLENHHKTGNPGQFSYHTPDPGTPIYADKSELQKYLQSFEDKKKDKKKKDDEVKQKKDDEVKELFNNLPKSDKDLINEFEKQINSNDAKALKTSPELVEIVSKIVNNNNNTKALDYLLKTNENFKKSI